MASEDSKDMLKNVDWKTVGGLVTTESSQPVVKKRLPKKIRQVPECYFLPRRSLPSALAIYGAVCAAGVGAGMLLEVWINKKIKEDSDIIWEMDAFVGNTYQRRRPTAAATTSDGGVSAGSSAAVSELGVAETDSVSANDTELDSATVPCWDDVAVPNTEMKVSRHLESKSIGYVLDEWDEEYDRGRLKKVRKSKEDFGGPNPFQEEADFISQRRMKQKTYKPNLGMSLPG